MNSNQEIFLRTIKNNPVKIANKLGFTLLGDLHNEWLKSFLFGKNDETLQAHRGSYKIGNHYYITNSENITNDDFSNAIKNGKSIS